jgi:predicted Rossmann fold nucleotide-binding protein DprA/Smf involved in DNA uptake
MDPLQLSEDTKAILLLCGSFGDPRNGTDAPLSLSEYNRVAAWLSDHKYRPCDLVAGTALARLKSEHPPGIDATRCERLLARGATMAFALERWTNKGVWVVCRSDADYPQRLREHLRSQAPPVLYGIGERHLLDKGGLAVVGSRNIEQNGSDFASEVAHHAARQGLSIVSGGARGVDQIAMNAALEAGGCVVGVLADSLLRTSLHQGARAPIRRQQLTLISAYHPEAGWNVGNAMGRNKHIYALSDYAVVVSSDYQKGGTWEGALEELRRSSHIPVFVRAHNDAPKGNQELSKRGALPFPDQPWDRPFVDLLTDVARNARVNTPPPDMVDLFAGIKQEAVSVPSDPAEPADKSDRAPSGEPTKETSAHSVFEAVLPILCSALSEPRTIADLAAALDIQQTQLNRWVGEATRRGLLTKLTKPTRYVAIPSGESCLLFTQGRDVYR